MNERKSKSVLISTVITLIVIAMLIISGPAQAVSVIISGLQDTPYAPGSRVNFTITVNITDPDRYVPLKNITLDVTGPASINRNFTLDGTPVSGSTRISMTPVLTPQPDQRGFGYGYGFDIRTGTGSSFGYGYGYGYGYGAGGGRVTFKYNVSINTTSLPAGSYTAVASLNTGESVKPSFTSSPASFRIRAPHRISIEINPTTINVNMSGRIKVTIDGSGIDISGIDIPTVRLGRGGAVVVDHMTEPGKLMLFFDTPLTGINCGDTEVTLTGKTREGDDIIGNGSIRTKDCTIETEITIDSSNKTNTTITRESPSGNGRIIILVGTRALDREGNPLQAVTLNSTNISENARRKLPSDDRTIGEPLDMGPDGATFDPPLRLRFNYTEPLPDGILENSLRVRSYNPDTDSWEILNTYDHNTADNYIIAYVPHFSTFALIGTVVAEAPSGGGGGGGSGGGGVVSSEPYDNILKAERIEKSLIANTPVVYTFTVPELGVYEVAVTGSENENDISLRVEALKGTSKLVSTPAPGTVYRNVNIWAGTKRIKEAVIRFRVENSWLDSNGFTGSDVVMVKWDGSRWIKLDISLSPRDGSYTYLEAKTDTFSIFAITGLKGGVLPVTTPTMPGGTPGETGTGTPVLTPTPPGEAPPVNLTLIAGAIVAVALVIVVYIKRKDLFKK